MTIDEREHGASAPRSSTLDPRSSAFTLWAKTDRGPDEAIAGESLDVQHWLCLPQHCRDSSDVGFALASDWLPHSLQARLSTSILGDSGAVSRVLAWLAGTHDIGKAEISFQSQIAGDPRNSFLWENVRSLPEAQISPDPLYRRPHSANSELIIRRWLQLRFPGAPYSAIASVAAISGCHHGRPSGISWQRSRAHDHQRDIAEHWLDLHGEPWASMWWQMLDDITARTKCTSALTSLLDAGGLRVTDQLLLAGFVSMCDWIASNQALFPLTLTGCHDSADSRAGDALIDLGLTRPWRPDATAAADYRSRFGWPPGASLRPTQEAAARIASAASGPTLLIIEDETGRGKTEAAQLAGEILAARTGAGGLAFALPSMTTTDAMLPRLLSWTRNLAGHGGRQSIRLMHSRASLNAEFERLLRATRNIDTNPPHGSGTEYSGESVIAHAWFGGRKGVLSEFLVCTVDQILMMALATRYVTMRHLGLAGKVVVIDEVHSYDVYTSDYLARALTWLAAQGASVILLSATLASGPRSNLASAYSEGLAVLRKPAEFDPPNTRTPAVGRSLRRAASLRPRKLHGEDERFDRLSGPEGSPAYPRITSVANDGVHVEQVPAPAEHREVRIAAIADEESLLLALVERLTADGGVIGVVCNTVTRAQSAYSVIASRFPGSVDLLHSRFIAADRARKEIAVTRALGAASSTEDGTRPRFRVVVGTQVIEQSLDIDFDVLISDFAPTDALAQRVGRLHRHERSRPAALAEAQLFLRGADLSARIPEFDRGSVAIYGERVLLATAAVTTRYLEGTPWCVRHDLADDVESTYCAELEVPQAWVHRYDLAVRNEQRSQHSARRRASVFQLSTPQQAQGKMPTALKAMTVIDADIHEAAAQASVRDIDPSLEVCLVQRTEDGLYPLQWLLDDCDTGIALNEMTVPPYRLAQAIADSTVRLPRSLVPLERLDAAIDELESLGLQAWQGDFRLRGQLILPIDSRLHGRVIDREFVYDSETGIIPIELPRTNPATRGGTR